LGVATVINPDSRTPEAFREATQAILSRPSCRQHAQQLCDEIKEMPGNELGVALLERLSRERANHRDVSVHEIVRVDVSLTRIRLSLVATALEG
jgi:hypothetical protein